MDCCTCRRILYYGNEIAILNVTCLKFQLNSIKVILKSSQAFCIMRKERYEIYKDITGFMNLSLLKIVNHNIFTIWTTINITMLIQMNWYDFMIYEMVGNFSPVFLSKNICVILLMDKTSIYASIDIKKCWICCRQMPMQCIHAVEKEPNNLRIKAEIDFSERGLWWNRDKQW